MSSNSGILVGTLVVGALIAAYLFGSKSESSDTTTDEPVQKKQPASPVPKAPKSARTATQEALSPDLSSQTDVDPSDGQLSRRMAQARSNPHHDETDIKAEAAACGSNWTDPDFPHDDSSLFVTGIAPPDWLRDGERGKVLKNVSVSWKRPHEFCVTRRPLGVSASSGNPTWLYDDKTSDLDENQTAQDVQQGSTGDCYFLSALALATRDTNACRDLIDDSMEEHGIYGVTLYVDGKWTMVYVDNCFPCYTSNDVHGAKPKPIYAKSTSGKEIWPMVVEKAWAKVHGSYQAIGEGGLIAHALEALTGGHARTARVGSLPWPQLKAAVDSHDCFVGAGSLSNLEEKFLNGIVGGHAYSILQAVAVPADEDKGNEELNLLLLRNPWSHGEWKGDWSDGSRMWDRRPDAVTAIGDKAKVREGDDGAFFISYDDFIERFATVDFCRIKNGQLKERNLIHKVKAKAADADDGGNDNDWLSGIGDPVSHQTSAHKKKRGKKGKKKH